MSEQKTRARGWRLGRLLGADVIVQPATVAMIAILGLLYSERTEGITAAALGLGVAQAVIVFISVFIHEFSHALSARAFGRRVSEIVITLWGGHTSFDARSLTPGVSGLTALAGPAANLALGALAFGALQAPISGTARSLVEWVVISNVLLGIFNLLPGLPMDGGAVLEAIVWKATGNRESGTRVAAWGGRAVTIAIVAWAVVLPFLSGGRPTVFAMIWAFFIASMLWPAATAALNRAQRRERVQAVTARGAMVRAVAVDYRATVADAWAEAQAGGAPAVVVTAVDGAFSGHVPAAVMASVPAEARSTAALDAVTVPLPRSATIDADADGAAVIAALREWWGRTDALVVTEKGAAVGVLTLSDAAEAFKANPRLG